MTRLATGCLSVGSIEAYIRDFTFVWLIRSSGWASARRSRTRAASRPINVPFSSLSRFLSFYAFSQVLLGAPSSLLSFLLAPVVNAEEEGARSSFHVAFLETCVSYSDIGAGRENKTPPPMHRVRCLGYLGRHTEGGETARTAVSFFLRLPSDRFLSFHSTQSQTRRRLLFFAARPRGKSSARHQDGITRPSIERKHYITLSQKISREIFGVHIYWGASAFFIRVYFETTETTFLLAA